MRRLLLLLLFVFSVGSVSALDGAVFEEPFQKINHLTTQGKVDTGFVVRLAMLQDSYAHHETIFSYLSAIRHYAADIVFALELQEGDIYLGHKYYLRHNLAYYDNYQIHEIIDTNFFEVLGPQFARDNECVFYRMRCTWYLGEADWTLLDSFYSNYGSAIYRQDTLLLGLDAQSYQYLGDDYAIDNDEVYYAGKAMNYDPASFVYLGHGYVKDKSGVYYRNVLTEHEPQDFEVLDYGYARSEAGVFKFNQKMAYDPGSFEVLGQHYIKDKTGMWFDDDYIGEEREGFQILDYPFAKDNTFVYDKGEKVTRLHAKSFAVIDSMDGLIQDKYGTYKRGQWYEGTLWGRVANLWRRLISKISE